MFIIQDLMRKHQRLLLAIILVLVVGPFVLWGGGFGASKLGGDEAGQSQGIVVSGDMTITAEEFRDALYAERDRLAQMGREPTMEKMLADGTALRVLESIVSRDIISKQAAAQGYDFDKAFLTEQMKKMQEFQDQNGNFDPRAWNSVVERGDVNWNAIYASLREQLGRRLYIERLMASGRVLDSELKEQFERENTTLSLRYVKIQPPIEPTDEQIQKTYDDNPAAFDLPAKRKAAFVTISVEAPVPPLANELVKRARAGEDFAELAKQYSEDDSKEKGGDIGWVTESLALPEYQKPLFALAPGEVSEPVKGPAGYYIFKVDEERTSELSGQRDVKAREIVLHATLDPDEMKARRAKADEIDTKAKESGDLAAVAKDYGLDVKETDLFSTDSLTIENIPADDARSFRVTLSTLDDGAVSDVVSGRKNLYVAKIVGYEPPQPQPLEAVREDVKDQTISKIRKSPEYAAKVQTIVNEIKEKATGLDDIPTMFPDLNAKVESVDKYSFKDFNFGSAPPWMPRDLYAAVGDKETGVMTGPINDLLGDEYFVEVAKRTPPDEKMWADEWPEAEKSMRKVAYNMARQARLDDRLRALRESSPYPVDQAAFMQALGLGNSGTDATTAEKELEGDGSGNVLQLPVGNAASAPAEAPAENAPESPATAEPAAPAEAPAGNANTTTSESTPAP